MACGRWEWWEKHTLNHTHSDGRNVDLEIWYVSKGSFMFQQPWSKHKMLFPLCLGRLYVDGHLGSWFMASWRGLYAGTLEEMEVRRDAVLNRAVSKWGEGCQDWGCHHVNGGPSRDLQWWNWHFPDREGDFLFNTSRSWQRSTTFWCPWVWVPHVACQDRTSEMQCGWISKHWYRGSNFPKYWRPR